MQAWVVARRRAEGGMVVMFFVKYLRLNKLALEGLGVYVFDDK